jgi:hypothetical protein
MVADPLQDNPRFGQQYYNVNIERLVASILLGIVTYDANLLILEPREPLRRTLMPGGALQGKAGPLGSVEPTVEQAHVALGSSETLAPVEGATKPKGSRQ